LGSAIFTLKFSLASTVVLVAATVFCLGDLENSIFRSISKKVHETPPIYPTDKKYPQICFTLKFVAQPGKPNKPQCQKRFGRKT
jgi:hypothetical protein